LPARGGRPARGFGYDGGVSTSNGRADGLRVVRSRSRFRRSGDPLAACGERTGRQVLTERA
jgi:hypothetical protein